MRNLCIPLQLFSCQKCSLYKIPAKYTRELLLFLAITVIKWQAKRTVRERMRVKSLQYHTLTGYNHRKRSH